MRVSEFELFRFLRASLVQPVPLKITKLSGNIARRRRVVLSTLAAAGAVLAMSFLAFSDSQRFYVMTLGLASTWVIGAIIAGPIRLGWATTRTGGVARPFVQSTCLALLLTAVFLLGAAAIGRFGTLHEEITQVTDRMRNGPIILIMASLTYLSIAEELFFRNAVFDALRPRNAVLISTLLYGLVIAASGNIMYVFAAMLLGTVTGMQRRVSKGVMAPIITHVIWLFGMLLVLPPLLRWVT